LPDTEEIAAIVLAAGASRRFGADKLAQPVMLHGLTLPLAAHSLLPWLNTFGQVTVVVRPGTEDFCRAIETALGPVDAKIIRWVVCEDAAQGMAASLVCGVKANHGAYGWLIGLADMPAVPQEAIAGVRDALIDGAPLARAVRGEKHGHPVGFAAHYRDELLALEGDVGARSLLQRDSGLLVRVEIAHDGIFTDIDKPSDLQSICHVSGDGR
jgi:molybdenum cofactor cytidylyltransferase